MDFDSLLRSIDWYWLETTVMRVLAVLLCLTVHETCHGLAAYALGDPTARDGRRLSLNPLRHIDWLGFAMMLFAGFGWAKPVPVDPRYFKKPKCGMALTALAGPVSNLLAGLAGAVVMQAMRAFLTGGGVNAVTQFIYAVLNFYVLVNIGLAAFNLLPIPPLDGSRILGAFLSDRALATYYRYQNIFVMVMFMLLISGVFSMPLALVENAMSQALFWLAGLPFRLFGVL